MINAVSNKIRLLKHIQPDKNWLQSQRDVLFLEISKPGKESNKFNWKELPAFLFSRQILKPVLVSWMVLALLYGGGVGAISVVKNSLPGDLLYPVKITLENIKIKISSKEDQTKLQAELIGIRIGELNQIINNTNNPANKKERVVRAVDNLQAQIVSTKAQLNEIKQGAEPNKVVEAADIISKETAQSGEILTEAKEKLAQELKDDSSKNEAVNAMDAVIKETSTLALELKQAKSGAEVQMEVEQTTEPIKDKINN